MVKYKQIMKKAIKHSEYPIVFPCREPGTVKARQEQRGEVRLLSRWEEMPVRDPALWEKSRSPLRETKWNRVF